MTQHAHLDPSPFLLRGGPVGVLLIHGLSGAPTEMRPVADYLHQRGYTVSVPLLPGHGTSADDLNSHRWVDWVRHAEDALASLRSQCQTVFVAGLSLGSLLALHLAADHPELAGCVTYSPAVIISDWRLFLVPWLKYLFPQIRSDESSLIDPEIDRRIWCYDVYATLAIHETLKLAGKVRRLLPRVTCPVLVVYSTADPHIHWRSPRMVCDRVGTTDRELVVLHNAVHCLTVGREWQRVARETCEWVRARSGGVDVEPRGVANTRRMEA